MNVEDFLALLLAGFALVLIATAFGATLMWRVVHLPSQPPALPVWVSSILVASGALWIAAAVVAGQWLGIASAVLITITFVIQLLASLRHRYPSGQ